MSSKASILASALVRVKQIQEREQFEGRLLDFADYVWPVVEPAIPFIKGWAIEAIAEHLEAVTYGDIRRLLINVPPGFMKSLLTDVFWPAWEWGPRNMPWLRYVCASYSNHLTERDNMRCRNIVISDRYQKLWGNRFAISNEQFTKIKFANDKTGWKLATSVGGVGVGERGDRFIIDDANNTMEMESEQVRNTTNMWFTEVVPDRLNNPAKSAIVVIQQRLHAEDVSGVAIERDMGYTHLMIPMEHDVTRHCVTVVGYNLDGSERKWEDPREEDGELAWPERFPEHVSEQIKNDKGPFAWAGQYQQSPTPRGGAIIKEDWWQLWKEPRFPAFEYIIASVDSAYTEKEENDASALSIWGVFRDEANNPKIMLIWAWQGRLTFTDLVNKIIDTCVPGQSPTRTGPSFPVDRILIEAKASGISVAQELVRLVGNTGKVGIEMVTPPRTTDKVSRVYTIEHLFTDGMIYAPDRQFADMMIEQVALFPKGSKDDLVDTMSQALRYLREKGFALRREEYSVVAEDELMYRSPSANVPLYPV